MEDEGKYTEVTSRYGKNTINSLVLVVVEDIQEEIVTDKNVVEGDECGKDV